MLLEARNPTDINELTHGTCSTPLHLAMEQEHADVVILLLKKKADCTIRDEKSLTPFDLVSRVSPHIGKLLTQTTVVLRLLDSREVPTEMNPEDITLENLLALSEKETGQPRDKLAIKQCNGYFSLVVSEEQLRHMIATLPDGTDKLIFAVMMVES